MDEKTVKQEIQKLIDKFERITSEGKYKKYNEENTKKDFILPLFRILGWKVEDSDEVKAEEKVSKKRVDYAFRLHGVPKFYLECKPFRENISDPKYAKQAIEYAWNKSVTWAVLCNFEGMRVFNAEWKWNDKQPTRNQFLDLRYNEYNVSCFKYLTWLSREKFEQGILDKQATILGKKTKKLPISKQLLADFTDYRSILSKDILRNNPKEDLSQDELDEIVQRILDRIIFIRTCEDKEIESDKLESLVRIYGDKEKNLYKKLSEKFRAYDEGYNSKLFLEHICEKVVVSNDVLKQIILGTYRSKNFDIRYDFSAINADVLGNIYEQYLGHILKSTAKRAKLTNGKAHRKEQGIYYTPTYIVEYIVRNTLGEKLKKRKLKVDDLKILDPACGSGSFLIKSFDILSEHITKKEGKTQQARFEDALSGSSKILKRKTELLKNCIYGVDLDQQAVEIAQLNLLLKLAEKRQRLPTLQENIKCGNSLISDIEVAKNKAFSYQEFFPEIMNNGGFDIVIGNPPYVRPHNISTEDKEYFWKNFNTFKAKSDLYNCFMEKGIELIKQDGLFSFIVPHTWTSLESFFEIRKYIVDNCRILKLVQLPKKVFQDATVETCIFVLSKEKSKNKRDKNKIVVERLNEKSEIIHIKEFSQDRIKNNHLYNFELYSEATGQDLLDKIKNKGKPLDKYVNFFYGLKTADDDKFIFNNKNNDNCKKLLRSKDIDRYSINFDNNYVWYVPELMKKNKKTARPGDKKRFETEKIIIARMGKEVVATYDNEKYYVKDGMILLKKDKETNLKFITALLNSKVLNYFYKNYFITIDVLKNALLELPIVIPDKTDIEKIATLATKIIELQTKLNKIKNKITDEKIMLEDEIKKTNGKIDELVFKLYKLTKEEIKIIEDSINN
jgi:type I restriction-modification system DNA methylase subunit